jgi:hypothetical protein
MLAEEETGTRPGSPDRALGTHHAVKDLPARHQYRAGPHKGWGTSTPASDQIANLAAASRAGCAHAGASGRPAAGRLVRCRPSPAPGVTLRCRRRNRLANHIRRSARPSGA